MVRVSGKRGRNMWIVSVVVRCLFVALAYAMVMARRRSLAAMHAGLVHLNGGGFGGGEFCLRSPTYDRRWEDPFISRTIIV